VGGGGARSSTIISQKCKQVYIAPTDSGYRGGFNVDVMVDRFCSVTKEMKIEKQQLKCSSRGRAHLERCGPTNLSVTKFQFM
jgi:hypothetical protein